MLTYLFHIVVGIFVFFGLTISVSAHVISGPHILHLMTRQIGKADRLRVSQKLVLNTVDAEQGPVEFQETLRYIFPDSFRSETVSETVHRVHVSSGQDRITIMDSKIATRPESAFDLYKDLLLYHSRELLQDRLERLGIDVSTSSLGRNQDKIVYIIGADYPDETRSQVWVDQASFTPIRWLLARSEAGEKQTMLEFRYGMWQEVDSVPYPMHIQILQDGFLLREIFTELITVNPTFATDLFDIEYLRTQYEAESSEKTTTDDLGEVEKTIQEFKKLYQ